MGLLDEISGSIKNALAGSNMQGNVLSSIEHLLTSADHGGLQGIVQQFKDKGFGDIINSWIGTGANLPISQDKIQQVLGSGILQQLAQKAGISTDEISKKMTVLLPEVIDKLTPNGKLPESGALAETLNMLKNQFLGK
ncbi:MAG TPA: YidB family protein [Nitrospirota bacterium]|nr:YidB family protein [Nitrospirota bacterium]